MDFRLLLKIWVNEHDKEIPKERYISPEERQETVDEMILKQYNKGISKNNKFD